MSGVIINKGYEYFTYLEDVFDIISNKQIDFNWLIESYECYPENEKVANIFNSDTVFISGKDLTELNKLDETQWIWGIFHGFNRNISEEQIKQEKYETNNIDLVWDGNMFHPLAEIEIIAWDSSATIILSKDNLLIKKIMENNDNAVELSAFKKNNM